MEDEVDFDLNLLALDAALANTGYCLYQVSTGNFSFRISKFGVIETDAKQDMSSRIRLLFSNLHIFVAQHNVNYIVCEEPPNVIFGNKRLPGNVIAGKAANVIKLTSSYYALMGFFDALQIYFRGVQPSQWQDKTLSKVKQEMQKRISIRMAQDVLGYLGVRKEFTQHQDHIADAINIGFFAIKKLKNKEWLMPKLHESESLCI